MDINSISEGFTKEILNIMYDFKVEDLIKRKLNFMGIDLGNKVKGVALQIILRKDWIKIVDSFDKIYKNSYNADV